MKFSDELTCPKFVSFITNPFKSFKGKSFINFLKPLVWKIVCKVNFLNKKRVNICHFVFFEIYYFLNASNSWKNLESPEKFFIKFQKNQEINFKFFQLFKWIYFYYKPTRRSWMIERNFHMNILEIPPWFLQGNTWIWLNIFDHLVGLGCLFPLKHMEIEFIQAKSN